MRLGLFAFTSVIDYLTFFNRLMNYKNVLIENISSLFVLQMVNYLFPLIVFPYLVRVLGWEKYGLITYAFIIIQYFILITDYGFNLNITRDISVYRNDKKKLAKIVSEVFCAKMFLMIISFIILLILVTFVGKFNNDRIVYLISFIAVVGNFIFPLWFFQGIEKLKTVAFINIISKLFVTILIFIFIKNSSDYVMAAGLQSSSVLVAGIISLFVFYIKYPVIFNIPTRKQLLNVYKDGWHVFISQVSISFISNTPLFILGLFANLESVGYYAIAYKICQVAINIHVPIANAIYPRLSGLFTQSYDLGLRFIKKIFLYGSILFALVSVMMFLTADLLVKIVSGEFNGNVSLLVKIMAILPISVFLDNLCGVQNLLNTGRQKEYMFSLLFGGISCIILSVALTFLYKEIGTAVAFVLSELIILFTLYAFVKKTKPKYDIKYGISNSHS